MSGADIVGIISGIIAIVDASIKIYNAAKDTSGLPSAFRDAAARLPLIHNTLTTAMSGLANNLQQSSPGLSFKEMLENCIRKARRLEEIFLEVIPPADAGRWERLGMAVKTVPRGNEVETLMDAMLVDLQVLTFNHAVRAVTREEIEKLVEVAATGRDLRNFESRGQYLAFNNSASGTQVTHTQSGNLTLHTGTGKQVNLDGPTNGTYYF